MKKLIPFAIAYDFDGTLAPGNMQERDFIPKIGMKKKAFWDEVVAEAKTHKADSILMYMMLMLRKAHEAQLSVRKKDFNQYGKNLDFFDGVLPNKKASNDSGWFDRINKYGKQSGVDVQHYIVSSGIREMVEGTPINKKFKSIFASSFYYDHNGIANWPALALNYTTKTQCLFRINKGCLDIHNEDEINKYLPDEKRAVPFPHMIYIGDGATDIPCFRLVKDRGGYSIAVYRQRARGAKTKCDTLFKEGRLSFIAPANYKDGGTLDKIVKALIDKVASDNHLAGFKLTSRPQRDTQKRKAKRGQPRK